MTAECKFMTIFLVPETALRVLFEVYRLVFAVSLHVFGTVCMWQMMKPMVRDVNLLGHTVTHGTVRVWRHDSLDYCSLFLIKGLCLTNKEFCKRA